MHEVGVVNLHPPGDGDLASIVPLIVTVDWYAHEGILNDRIIPFPQEASITTVSLKG